VEVLEAMAAEHRIELAKRDMQLVRYRSALEEHGIEPPDMDGEELLRMWRDCRHVMSTASQFVMRLGTSKELLMDWGTGAPR
jgi:hypothetical protein